MHTLAFGGDAFTVGQLLRWFIWPDNVVNHLPDNGTTLYDWCTKIDEPDVILYLFEPESADLEDDLEALALVRLGQPQIRIICVSQDILPNIDLGKIMTLGIPIITTSIEDPGYREVLALTTTKWPGFNPTRTFTPAIVRTMPDTQS